MNKSIKPILVLLFLLALFILFIIPGNDWMGFLKEKEKETVSQTEIIKEEEHDITLFGILMPAEIVDIGSQISGRIDKIYVDFNFKVEKDQILAELNQSAIRERIKQYEANIRNIEINLRRTELRKRQAEKQKNRRIKLYEGGLISLESKENLEINELLIEADIESLSEGLKQARSQLETSNIDLSYTIIKSPINGIVLERKVNEGQTVAAGFQAPILFRVANLKEMQIECNIDEKYLKQIKEGHSVTFSVELLPEEFFNGKIKQIRYLPRIIDGIAKYPTIIGADNQDMKLRPGIAMVKIPKDILKIK